MLRWKTLAAVCAFGVSACPMTSFAQQIVKPARPEIPISQQRSFAANSMLQPSAASSVRTATFNQLDPLSPTQSPVQRGESPEITIRTPFVHPQNPNLYLFVVENVGSVDATSATVDLYVPANVTITNVVPSSAASNTQRAHVRLANLAAGSKSIIEIEVSPTTDTVEFQTRIALESVHTFSTSANQDYLVRPATHPVDRNPGVQNSLAPLAITAQGVPTRPAKSAATSTQASVDAKLLKTVESLRAAGQNALADAYIAAVANSSTFRAETF